jgi:hypothetical protein
MVAGGACMYECVRMQPSAPPSPLALLRPCFSTRHARCVSRDACPPLSISSPAGTGRPPSLARRAALTALLVAGGAAVEAAAGAGLCAWACVCACACAGLWGCSLMLGTARLRSTSTVPPDTRSCKNCIQSYAFCLRHCRAVCHTSPGALSSFGEREVEGEVEGGGGGDCHPAAAAAGLQVPGPEAERARGDGEAAGPGPGSERGLAGEGGGGGAVALRAAAARALRAAARQAGWGATS